MGKLEGKVAVITGGTSGMALASAKLFVEEGAYVFVTGRKQEQIDEAVKFIGLNVTGVQGDAANLDDLDRLFEIVKREKGKIDILFASAGIGDPSTQSPARLRRSQSLGRRSFCTKPGRRASWLSAVLARHSWPWVRAVLVALPSVGVIASLSWPAADGRRLPRHSVVPAFRGGPILSPCLGFVCLVSLLSWNHSP
jgi:NAD(P)-dependent dehydrogenase (short-subunit alcohol dehydrogenase family)